jgi:hypothetical protein
MGLLLVAAKYDAGCDFCKLARPCADMTMLDELERWLTARFEREREATLTLVLKLLESMLNETLRHNGEAHEKELKQLSAKMQASLDRMLGVLEQQQERIDRAARGEPLDRMN